MNDPTAFRQEAPGSQPDNNSPHYRSTSARHPKQRLLGWAHTVTETTGPRFSPHHFPPIADLCAGSWANALSCAGASPTKTVARCSTMIEVWQAKAAGRYNHPGDTHTRNDADPLLDLIDDPARRATLIAAASGGNEWRFDIVLQGAGETVSLDI